MRSKRKVVGRRLGRYKLNPRAGSRERGRNHARIHRCRFGNVFRFSFISPSFRQACPELDITRGETRVRFIALDRKPREELYRYIRPGLGVPYRRREKESERNALKCQGLMTGGEIDRL